MSEPSAVARRYAAVGGVLTRVLLLNLGVASAKIVYGYLTGAVSILSDGFHSLTDSSSNVVALVGIRVARRPPDANHPYGHRKYETLAAGGVFVLLLFMFVEVLRTASGALAGGATPRIGAGSFVVMLATLAVNLVVVRYEKREAARLNSEVLHADSLHTQSDLWTSLTVIAALAGVALGWPWMDPAAGLVVAVFIAKAGFEVAREASRILSDEIVIAEEDLRDVVMSEPHVRGCHQIRTRGSADHVFLDLHIWLDPAMRLDEAHAVSHRVKDRLIGRYPQIADAIIHIEPDV